MRGSAARMERMESGRSSSRGREVSGIVLLGLALFIGLSVGSLQLGAGTLMGPCGATVGLGVYALFGIGAYLVAIGLGAAAVRCLQGRPVRLKSVELWAAIGAGLSAAVLLHLAFGRYRLRGFSPGGLVGEYGAELLVSLVGRVGAALFGAVGLAVALVLSTPISFRTVGGWLVAGARSLGATVVRGVIAIFPERGEREDEHDDEDEARAPAKAPLIRGKGKHADDTIDEVVVDVKEEDVAGDETSGRIPLDAQAPPAKKRARKRDDEAQVVKIADAPKVAASAEGAPTAVIENEKTEISAPPAIEREEPKIVAPLAPKIVEPLAAKKKELAAVAPAQPAAPKPDYIPAAGGYHLPDLSLLDYTADGDDHLDRQSKDEMLALADKLQKTLGDYGVRGNVVEIHPGPVVTMYEFVPAPGTKLSRITGLSNDLAMALAALRVRIVAPIPGKASVGIE